MSLNTIVTSSYSDKSWVLPRQQVLNKKCFAEGNFKSLSKCDIHL